MASTASLQSSLDAAKVRLNDYNAELPTAIKNQINNAWTPVMNQQAQNVANLKAEFLPKYWGSALNSQPGMGSSEADLSPTMKLQQMGRTLGQFSGDIGKQQGVFDYLGGNMKDLYQQALDAAKFGQATAQQSYQNLWGEYQLAAQQEEAARQRAAVYAGIQQDKNRLGNGLNLAVHDPYVEAGGMRSRPGSGGVVQKHQQTRSVPTIPMNLGPVQNVVGRQLGGFLGSNIGGSMGNTLAKLLSSYGI